MSLPAVVLSLAVASLYGGLFDFFFAQRAADILRYWAVAIIGFAAGALVGLLVPWHVLVIGEVHLLEGTVGSVGALFFSHWLQSRPSQP